MPKLNCTEPVCRHEWSEREEPRVPRCPRCGGFWVRAEAPARRARPAARLLARPAALLR